MKHTILTLAFLAAAAVAEAQSDVALVYLDGQKQFEALSAVGRLEILGGGTSFQLVGADGVEILASGSLADLARLSFVETPGVQPDIPTSVPFVLSGADVVSDAPSAVYSLSGACVRRSQDGVVSTAGLAPGVYIVVSGLRAAKIIVK